MIEQFIEHKREIAAGLVLTFGAAACAESATIGDNAASVDGTEIVNPSTTELSQSERSELADLLTVHASDESLFDCGTDVDPDTVEFGELADGTKILLPKILSTLPTDSQSWDQDHKYTSDSVANPISFENLFDKNDALREFQSSVCEGVDIASMTANYFANLEVDGTKVIDLNPWLEGYEGEASVINDNAADLMPQYLDADATDEEIETAYSAHQELAGKLNTLMERFDNVGIREDITTTFNYALDGGGILQVGEIPEFIENDKQYTGKFIVFKLTAKDGRCYKAMLVNVGNNEGFKAGDQRIAEADIDNCDGKPVGTTSTTTPRRPRGTTTVPATTTTGRPGTTTTTTTTTVPDSTTTTILDARPEVTVPAPEVISGPGVGGEPDPDNNPDNNTTTSTTSTTSVAPSETTSTTTEAVSVTSTTLGPVVED